MTVFLEPSLQVDSWPSFYPALKRGLVMSAETKYKVPVVQLDKPKKVPKVVSEQLKGVASGKMMSRFRKESVACPIIEKDIAFLVCFACPSFQRRVSGVVDCAGKDGPPKEWILG